MVRHPYLLGRNSSLFGICNIRYCDFLDQVKNQGILVLTGTWLTLNAAIVLRLATGIVKLRLRRSEALFFTGASQLLWSLSLFGIESLGIYVGGDGAGAVV